MEREQLKRKSRKSNSLKPETESHSGKHHPEGKGVSVLQQKIGNRAVQRLITQRSSDAPAQLDDQVSQRINQARTGGEALHPDIQNQIGQGLGADFSQVRVHTSQESHELNQALGAKAFTTGKDIFFKEGAYDPHSSSGKELLAHELTHVVQQGTGQVNHSAGGMTVNAPGDAFEQEADQAARNLVRGNSQANAAIGEPGQIQRETELVLAPVQRQEEEEDELQLQEEDEQEEIQMQVEEEEEEEELQAKRG